MRDARGWRNLCRLLTLAHAHTREGPGRRERGEPSVSLEAVREHSEGLVCLTGCAAHGVHDEPTARRLLDAFGPHGLRVELQRPYARHDRARNRALEALARRLGVACVASGDVHAHARGRAELQDAFVALRHRTTLDACEPLRRGNHSHVLASPAAMAARFAEHPEAVRESVRLAEQLRFDLTRDLGYRYPGSEDPGAMRRLAELCRARLDERYGARAAHPEAAARLEEELRIIDELGLAGFFLLHHELLELAREVAAEVRGPDSARALLAPGRGRGSSVSSIVCYLTGLSHIDPIGNRLLLGRFLHTGLESLPDIDLDFPRDIREVLIPRVHERYGSERAALVAAFPTFRARGAIRELGKVLGLPSGEIERVARAADNHRGAAEHDIDGALGRGQGALAASLPRAARGSAGRLPPLGMARAPGRRGVRAAPPPLPAPRRDGDLHAAADRLLPRGARGDGGPPDGAVGQGLLRRRRLPEDRPARAGDALRRGRVRGADRPRPRRAHRPLAHPLRRSCHLPGGAPRGHRRGLPDREPRADAVAAAHAPREPRRPHGAGRDRAPRPDPGRRDQPLHRAPPAAARRPRLRGALPSPALRPVLESTLGTVIFQDQVMEVAQAFAGFSPREADGLRRAMSRKRSHEALQSHRERFIAGARRHVGADLATAQRVWEMVEGFAGFGFPKAHGAAFGLLAYQSTWLRVHYGPEFLCALMNEQPMGFYAPDTLVHEAEVRGIPVLGLDVNASEVGCTVEAACPALVGRREARDPDGAVEKSGARGTRLGVRLGLGYVKDVRADQIRELVAERERGGPFRDLGELAARCGAGRPTLEQLAWSGACDGLVDAPADAIHRAVRRGAAMAGAAGTPVGERQSPGRMPADASPCGSSGSPRPGMRSARRTPSSALPLGLPEAPRLRPLTRWQRLIADYATAGVTVGDHVMAALRPRLAAQMLATSPQLARLPQGSAVTIAGLVIARQRPGTAKGTMFLLFEDEWGHINLIVPRAVYERHRPLARAEPLLLARGRLERSAVERVAGIEEVPPVVNVIVRELAPLERFLASASGEEVPAQAQVHRLRGVTADEEGAEVGAGMRAVAPPVQSFASGWRR